MVRSGCRQASGQDSTIAKNALVRGRIEDIELSIGKHEVSTVLDVSPVVTNEETYLLTVYDKMRKLDKRFELLLSETEKRKLSETARKIGMSSSGLIRLLLHSI